MTLDKVPLNSLVEIVSINENFVNRNRLIELGFTEGCKIIPLHLSPLGDPKAYGIRGTLIALREEDAKNIKVK